MLFTERFIIYSAATPLVHDDFASFVASWAACVGGNS